MLDRDDERRPIQANEISLESVQGVGKTLALRPYARRGVPLGNPVRVVLVDDHEILRAGVKGLLSDAPDIVVVGEADGGRRALTVVADRKPDVVLMDLQMPDGDGETATAEIVALKEPPRVLILTMYREEERLIPLLKAGASGYLAKDATAAELIEAIRVVALGEIYLRPRVARMLAAAARPDEVDSPADAMRARLSVLSEREHDVLRLVAEGYNGREIGGRLGITAKTVDTYRQRIAVKIGVAHRTDYVKVAITAKLLAIAQ